jgi:hypothetical protein
LFLTSKKLSLQTKKNFVEENRTNKGFQMLIIYIVLYFVPIIVTAAIDQSVANGMLLLTVGMVPLINFLADTREGKLGLWAIWTILYYLIALNMLMTWLGLPLFE